MADPDADEKAIADFYAGLSPEDAEACGMDVLLYGSAFVRFDAAGVKRRVPAADYVSSPDRVLMTTSVDQCPRAHWCRLPAKPWHGECLPKDDNWRAWFEEPKRG